MNQVDYNPARRLARLLSDYGVLAAREPKTPAMLTWGKLLGSDTPMEVGRALTRMQMLAIESRTIIEATQTTSHAVRPTLDRIDALPVHGTEGRTSREWWLLVGDSATNILTIAGELIERFDHLKLVVNEPTAVRDHL